MHPIKKHKQRFINKYRELDDRYKCNGELIKLINYFFKRNWIYNIDPNSIKDSNNFFFNTKTFRIILCFDGCYNECNGFIKIYADLKTHYDKVKYCSIQCIIYKDNVDTLIKILEKLENDKEYYKLCDNREYLFDYGWIYTPDYKFKNPKNLKY